MIGPQPLIGPVQPSATALPPVKPPVTPVGALNLPSVAQTTSADKYSRQTGQLNPNYIDPNKATGPLLNQPATTPTSTPTPTSTGGGGLVNQPSADQNTINNAQAGIDLRNKQLDTAFETFNNTMNAYNNGSMPLTAGEQAQVDSLKRAYELQIEQQRQVNQGATGSARLSAYRGGAAEGTDFLNNVVNPIVAKGAQLVTDLNTKMAGAVATMTQAFKDGDIANIKMAWDEYNSYNKQRTDSLQKTVDDTQKLIKDKADAKIAADKVVADAQVAKDKVLADAKKEADKAFQDDVTKPLQELAKSARDMNAPQEVLDAILSSQSLADGYNVAGVYAGGGTGIVGEYNFYKAQAEAMGKPVLTFDAYQNQDANRKIKIAAAGNASGLTTGLINTALKLSDDYEARSKDYYTQREAFNRVISSASDPSAAGDLALIFNYMKTLDPGSTVREGEFATAQNSGSAFQIAGAKYNKVMNGERLTQSQRDDFVNRANKLFDGAKKQQDAVVGEFTTRAGQYGVPANLVIRGTEATGNKATDAIKDETHAQSTLESYITVHPEKKEEIDKKIKTAEQVLGRPITSDEFLLAHPEYR